MPDLAIRQRVLHHRLHLIAALGALPPGDHILGDRRLGIRLDVLDDPTPAGITSRNAAGAVGAPREAVGHGLEEGGHLARRSGGISLPNQTT